MTALVVLAKQPIAGRVKTRLHPPLSLEQAALVAEAAILDTLDVAREIGATRLILALDGNRPPQGSEDFHVMAQLPGTLDVRLAAVFDASDGPTVLIGMDTPQVTAADLARAFPVWPDDVDAVFGPAADGGFWAIGFREPRGEHIVGVPMSRSDTGAIQLQRLHDAGLRVAMLPELTDVDEYATALDVAAQVPETRFGRIVAAFAAELDAPRDAPQDWEGDR